MKAWRWLGSMVFLGSMLGLMGPNLPLFAQKDGEVTLKWTAFDREKGKDAKKFYQIMSTKTKQVMKVQGMEVTQEQNQSFAIEWTPQEKSGNNWVVSQKIVGVKMDIDIGGNKIPYDSTADTQPSNPMTDFFKALQTMDLKFHINPKEMKVEKIEGRDDFVKNLSKTNPQMDNLLKSILSEDALKKMTEPTLFAFPTTAVKKGSSWKKESTLDLGPIGQYKTNYIYTYAGKEKDLDKIKIEATMTYVPPKAGEGAKGLPFIIESGELSGKTVDAKNEKKETNIALFNQKLGRFESYSMNMHLDGKLKIDIGGMKTEVELSQDQTSAVETKDSNPWEKQKKQ